MAMGCLDKTWPVPDSAEWTMGDFNYSRPNSELPNFPPGLLCVIRLVDEWIGDWRALGHECLDRVLEIMASMKDAWLLQFFRRS